MDSLGTEIGQKMRSAVKAKLIELGTGSASGYIDDELPDYVMIMVANKRSRQQMVDDLSLFLGAQTEVFVNWLHQVLQKLQEVTLPASVAAKTMKDSSKKKSSSSSEKPRKDKKGKRRETSNERAERALSDDAGDKTPPRPSTATAPLAGGSITEVFANQYIEKAKKTLEVDASDAPPVKKATVTPSVASITDIATATVLQKHQKELRELEEIQQRINAAKQHLKSLGTEIPDDDDADFPLLKANDDDLLPGGTRSKSSSSSATGNSSSAAIGRDNQATTKQRQRITMEAPEQPSKGAATSRSTTPPPAAPSTPKEPNTPSTASPTAAAKRPVHERLGDKGTVPGTTGTQEPASNSAPKKQATESTTNSGRSPTKNTIISLSAHRREEREIYVPLFRRKEPPGSGVEPSKPRTNRPPDSHSHSVRGRSRERTGRVKTPPPPANVPSTAARRLSRERRLGPAPPRSIVDVPGGGGRDHRPSSRDRRSRSPVRASERRERSKNGCEPAPVSTVRSRIGSRVIVLPPKPDYNEDVVEVPVASVIKVQPRPTIPKAKQPSKNLLLKAMAEAQRSTVAQVRKRIDNTGALGGEVGKGQSTPFAPRIVENKPKLLIEIPGGVSGHSEVEVEYEDDEMLEDNRRPGEHGEEEQEEEEELLLRRRQAVYRNADHEEIGQHGGEEEEIHEVDIANQVLMEDSDGDDEFRQMLEGVDGCDEVRAPGHQQSSAHTGLEPIDDDDDDDDAVDDVNGDGTKFVVTLDGAFKGKDAGEQPMEDSLVAGRISPSHTPLPPPVATSSGQSTKARLPVKERIGLRRQPSSQQQPPHRGRQSPAKDSKLELEETLKKRKERFSEKPVAQPPPPSSGPSQKQVTPANDGPIHRSASPRGQRNRSPKPKAAPPPQPASSSPRSTNSARDRTPSLSPEPPERRDRYTDYQRQRSAQSRRRSAPSPSPEPARASLRPGRSTRTIRAGTGNSASNSSPSHLNELLLQRTKELMDESVSSSPIYMSKTDYDRMEPASRKRKRVSPIQFDLTDEDERQESDDDYRERRSSRGRTDERQQQQQQPGRGRSRQRGDSEDRERDRDRTTRESSSRRDPRERAESRGRVPSPGRKIKKLESSRKFDDIPPLLSAVSVSGGAVDGSKAGKGGSSSVSGAAKERCKYFPSCRQGDACEFLHPSTPCKAFPGCKFGDKCLYLHPMCKYDLTCHRLDCNFMHSKGANASGSGVSAPPLASSVVPVQNYKTISAKPLPPLCKYYPHCSNTQCPFYHPKMCRFGRHCVNKVECNFYHYDLPPQELHESSSKDKFRWISPFSA
ncbi:PHD finger protein rhinoceros-like [Anopheles albimanus]|uniref:Zinc finger CCCH domain-containing protein 14 n=1 Tax=Anopheles albimanus TaxID=7167 RepID=A0A182FNH9_ANOAL|nr:PHD finger protein rhinoceros-like [Anopheles albimanus]